MSQSIPQFDFMNTGLRTSSSWRLYPNPSSRADEVLVKVHFAGVNPIDWKIRAGYLKD